MSDIKTPQVPLFDPEGKPFYPLTQYNQIVMPDGGRWDGKSGGAQIDDATPSGTKVYSSQKTQYELDQLSQQKADKTEIPAPYSLPTASATVKGGVMVGNGLAIDENGVLSLALADGDEVSY